ncbi:MAG: DUF3794 domain-containing protein [Clostridia bacterium]|nr:DUF3794 domain-containing protein [Clostridia bacterium]
MLELNKQEACVGEQSIIAFSQAYCEGDIIVPDTKPDIAKILQVSANVVIQNKHCAYDRVSVDGKCDISILYISEHNTVCSINNVQSFSHVIDAKGVLENMDAEVEADLQNIDYFVTNSRKLNVKMLIAIDVNATNCINRDLCVGVFGDNNVQTLRKNIMPFNRAYKGTQQFTIKECLELPAGKPDIDTILKSEMRLNTDEVKVLNDRIVVDGNAFLSVIYLDSNDHTRIHYVEYEIPFSEILDTIGAKEGYITNVRMKCEQLYTEPACDSDGDNRRINLEAVASACIKIYCESELEIIEDAYSTDCIVTTECKNDLIDKLVTCNKTQVTLKDTIDLPKDICQVFRICAKPNIADTIIEGNKVCVGGIMEVDVLYMADDGESPINCYTHKHKFTQYIECEGINEKMLCDVFVTVDSVSYNIAGPAQLEFRIIATIDTKIISKHNINYISDITVEEQSVSNTNNCFIKIYFVGKDDTLWEIAKKYRTTADKIIVDNNLSGEITPGMKLIIA